MPICAVGRGARGKGSGGLDERVVAGRVPEGDLVGRKVNLIDDIVPLVRLELRLPFALAPDHPLQVRVGRARLAIDPPVLELGEVALEEGDLVFVCGAGHVCCGSLDGEVVVYRALVDGGFGLGDEFCPPHVRVPLCGVVNRDLHTLLGSRVAGVLEVWREIDVFGDGAGAVDVVLEVSDLICPGPLLEVCGRGHLIETSIPENSACRHGTDKSAQYGSLSKHRRVSDRVAHWEKIEQIAASSEADMQSRLLLR